LHSRKAIALASLLFTYLFFFEYLPPVRWVHIPYDLQGFHYPLADYAFQSLRQGRFPLWDPTIYCGMSFVSNVQAALFYPPTWLMFLFNIGRERLSYQSMQDLLIAHVWLGFFLCYLWLRGKRLAELPCVLGAGVFAFSGYMCTQLQHFGLVAAYVWMPLALWGVDQAVERRSWHPLWKVAAASALAFLGGYPPTWTLFAVAVGVYSLAGAWRVRTALGTIAAVVFSLVLCAIQILPTWETTQLREPEDRFDVGIRDADIILSYALPNYFNFGLNVPLETNPRKDYFYLGVPALIGLPLLIRRRRFRDLAPSLAVLAASLVIAGNPFDIVSNVIRHSSLLPDLIRAWYFLAGVTLAFAPLTAYALDDFLSRKRSVPSWLAPGSAGLMAVWAGYELLRWRHQSLSARWGSGLFLLVTLALFGAGMYGLRAAQGRRRIWTAVALVLLVGADYKAFGTSKRFDAGRGEAQRYSAASFPGMEPEVYQQLRASPDYRIVADADTGLFPDDFRHVGWTTPQGFDPLLTTQFRKMVETYGHFQTDRMFEVDPENYDAMRLFGVRYMITSEHVQSYPKLKDNPHYRLLGSMQTYFRVYEYLEAKPPYSWEGSREGAEVERRESTPESRMFKVRTAAAGKLALHEQFFPGWTAWVDGDPAVAEPWMGAFLAVAVPAGEHTVEFRYHSRLLGLGRAISLVALIGLVYWIRRGAGFSLQRRL